MNKQAYCYFPIAAAERFAALHETTVQHVARMAFLAYTRSEARMAIRSAAVKKLYGMKGKAKWAIINAEMIDAKLPETLPLVFASWRALCSMLGMTVDSKSTQKLKSILDHLCEPLDDRTDREPMPALFKRWKVTAAGEIRIVVDTGSQFWFPSKPASSCVKLALLGSGADGDPRFRANSQTMLALHAWSEVKCRFGAGRFGPNSKQLCRMFQAKRLRDVTSRALDALNKRLVARGFRPLALHLNRNDQWIVRRVSTIEVASTAKPMAEPQVCPQQAPHQEDSTMLVRKPARTIRDPNARERLARNLKEEFDQRLHELDCEHYEERLTDDEYRAAKVELESYLKRRMQRGVEQIRSREEFHA